MAGDKVTCPNPECGAGLKVTAAAAGKRIRCPKCGTTFPVPDTVPAGAFAVAAEPDRPCPSCTARLPGDAVLCVRCGYNLKTGKKVQPAAAGGKKAGRRKARAASGPVGAGELPQLLDEADQLIELARREVEEPLAVLRGIAEDPATFLLRANSKILKNRCANPHCRGAVEGGVLMQDEVGNTGVGTVTVGFTFQGKQLKMQFCQECAADFAAELAVRQETLRALLGSIHEDLTRAAADFPKDREVRDRVREVERLGREGGIDLGKKKRACWIATAAHGNPDAADVEALRRFRDAVLLRSSAGRWLVEAYYRTGPLLAALLRRTRTGRAAVRTVLRPVAAVCWRMVGEAERGSNAPRTSNCCRGGTCGEAGGAVDQGGGQ